jgi:hypothetical protein
VYDYVDGKSDWMAYGLPVEGQSGPFAGGVVTAAATCRVEETVAQVRATVGATRDAVVVVDATGLVLGLLSPEALAGPGEDQVLDVMAVVPSTVRPSVEVSSLVSSEAERVLVTSSDGRLIGQVVTADLSSGPPHDHAAEGPPHDHAAEDAQMDALFEETMSIVRERFGDSDPSPEELRALLRERLIAAGRTPEQADQFLTEMDDDEESS